MGYYLVFTLFLSFLALNSLYRQDIALYISIQFNTVNKHVKHVVFIIRYLLTNGLTNLFVHFYKRHKLIAPRC